jgi:hypothetical protein
MTGPDKEQFVLPEEQFDLHQIALEGYVYFYPMGDDDDVPADVEQFAGANTRPRTAERVCPRPSVRDRGFRDVVRPNCDSGLD